MRKTGFDIWVLFMAGVALTYTACREGQSTIPSKYIYVEPVYQGIQLVAVPGEDSLHFPLGENTYNEIKSFNYFMDGQRACMSFYDRRSESVSVYDLKLQRLLATIDLKKCLKQKTLYKTSVYLRNFDSIFVVNSNTLYLLDSAGAIKNKLDFYNRTEAMAFFDNPLPAVIQKGMLYMGVRPYVDETSTAAVKRWRILYGFDLNKKEKQLYYNLPPLYENNTYDDRFFAYSFCVNEKGHFVFSFPADSNVYETDLSDHHLSYYGKSRFQKGGIKPFSRQMLESNDGLKEYMLRNSYGPIYFDQYHKRYIRVVRHGVSEADYASKNYKRKYSLIIFDQRLKIIGECLINADYSYNSIFFTSEGDIYARVNLKDEYALHFIRLKYLTSN